MVEEIDCLLQVKEATEEDNSDDEFTFAPHPSGKIVKYKKKMIFPSQPRIVGNNYFSDKLILDYIGKKGYELTHTCRRDRISKTIKPYLHHLKVTNYDQKLRVMHFQNPIVTVKQVKETDKTKAYTKTFVWENWGNVPT
jgi:hypothetical protein